MKGASGITPLDAWVKSKIGLSPEKEMTASHLALYQAHRLRWAVGYARRNSPFYRKRLRGLRDDFFHGIEDLAQVPFTTAEDLKGHHLDMLCVSQSEVSRVVTLRTSGSTAPPKRLFFTDDDLELTVDFFHHGMSTFTRPGDTVLILMPGRTPGSIGDLLKKGLSRMQAEGFVYGPVMDPDHAMETLLKVQPRCLVGLPVQVLGLLHHPLSRRISQGLIRSVLLSADYVPESIVRALEDRLQAPIFEHYGMTEMGLGGGVQCRVREGYHLREADLFFEVIDPESGALLARGEAGEIVVTTLTRRGMPLIRYRTGDVGEFLSEPCPCGSSLRRLGKVQGRIAGGMRLRKGGTLTLPEMDEVLFGIPGLSNYLATLELEDGRDCLKLQVHTASGTSPEILEQVETRIMKVPAVKRAVTEGRLTLGKISESPSHWPTTGTVKRQLRDRRDLHKRSI